MDGVILGHQAGAAVDRHAGQVVRRKRVDRVSQLRNGVHRAVGVGDLELLQPVRRHLVYVRVHAVLYRARHAYRVADGVGHEVRALRGAGIVGVHRPVLIEDLCLRVGVEQREQEGEHEHEDEYSKPHYGQLVSKEALRHEPAGRKDLDSFGIVQRQGLALVVDMLFLCRLTALEGLVEAVRLPLYLFGHICLHPSLSARGRAGPPRRTARPPGGSPAASGWR